MSAIFFLILIGIVVAGGFLAAFIWAVRSGQYEDDYSPSVRVLFDKDGVHEEEEQEGSPTQKRKQEGSPTQKIEREGSFAQIKNRAGTSAQKKEQEGLPEKKADPEGLSPIPRKEN